MVVVVVVVVMSDLVFNCATFGGVMILVMFGCRGVYQHACAQQHH